jgi:hypothetical protein
VGKMKRKFDQLKWLGMDSSPFFGVDPCALSSGPVSCVYRGQSRMQVSESWSEMERLDGNQELVRLGVYLLIRSSCPPFSLLKKQDVNDRIITFYAVLTLLRINRKNPKLQDCLNG